VLAVPLGASLAGVGVLVSVALSGSHGLKGASEPGTAGVAAAYRYPAACLSVTITADRRYAAARLDRASPCWRYGAYLTAIFERVDGAWRQLPASDADSCPLSSLPPAVQAQLGVCAQRASIALPVPRFYPAGLVGSTP
jgi:hypothetical protein